MRVGRGREGGREWEEDGKGRGEGGRSGREGGRGRRCMVS